jgi:hypothetical protein
MHNPRGVDRSAALPRGVLLLIVGNEELRLGRRCRPAPIAQSKRGPGSILLARRSTLQS